ncbi:MULTISPECIES: F0F1 ATP synthase subunit gamma [unclassified Devosia]|jgi:F-type H+-transporting ATPase subunit gamma|uniref:F0F1 ATP synthase subunit gamma n=1 Tax=unclassified Devosia TaxID=196773 RepID=UPI00145D07FA|nr:MULTISPECIES: F0F1 ATP synthase subunit gamma [unclassified Devosia]MBJ6988453.1 F0F1 ATP synthase subunit gamma [Devosia sp. MC521]MBJ7579157.1 F0F1 ATP synthase subunit gamma [Devosia sp. MC532]MBK1795545.1 F0F1 ATP synthase subunit gamma [Devosia sp. WQ 349K1]QMW62497.1 F0F1 ATP synthase subunit gamma [Devosia sp. MC521]
MPSLKDLKNRIDSVKSTQKITKAMQMVAAAKLRRAQEAAVAARPYAERMGAVLSSLAAVYDGQADAPVLLAGNGRDQVHLLVVATGERGLAGAFNSSIARLARDHVLKLQAEGKTVKILTVGRKGHDILRRQFADLIVDTVSYREVKTVGFAQASEISQRLQTMFAAGEFDIATLFFAKFNSVISQVPQAVQLIPAKIEAVEGAGKVDNSTVLYEYEPSEEAIVEDLLPRNISVQILRAFLENSASFYGAQMSAMDNATRNAGDMIGKLQLSYNRQRQAQITKELIEIISGAEAL